MYSYRVLPSLAMKIIISMFAMIVQCNIIGLNFPFARNFFGIQKIFTNLDMLHLGYVKYQGFVVCTECSNVN